MPAGKQALILDLDNTVFETRSMSPSLFMPFFENLEQQLKSDFDVRTIQSIMYDLWDKTWDEVMTRYGVSKSILLSAARLLNDLDIKAEVYPDYSAIKIMSCPKYLVTTSITALQESKITALNIRADFDRICINDPFRESKTKLDIFKGLMQDHDLDPQQTYVVGDNADSEIKAGNSLNMVTIQILRSGVVKGNNAQHYIHSFDELAAIMNITTHT